MKKNFIYALVSAIALTGAAGFTSCSDKDELAADNPGYDAKTGTVPVNFVFNVSTGNNAPTRMSEANTQANIANAFRGIENASLLSYKLGTTNNGKYVTSAIPADQIFDMGTILTAGAIDANGDGSSKPKSRRVIELALPTETNALMFWGKAIKTLADYQQGALIWNVSKDISQTTFKLQKVVSESSTDLHGKTAFEQYQKLMATVLTKIVQSSATVGGYVYNWSDYVKVTVSSGVITDIQRADTDPANSSSSLCALGGILADAFITMNKIYSDELRAGSGPDVARMIGDLYQVVNSVAEAEVTSDAETVAKNVGSAIVRNINSAFKNTASSCAWNTGTADDIASVKRFSGLQETEVNLVTEDLQNFPKNFNLPLGSVLLVFGKDNNEKYVYNYMSSVPTYAMGGTTGASSSFDSKNYVYPPELCYFGNSPLRVTNDDHITGDYPDGVSNWNNDEQWAAGVHNNTVAWTSPGHVLSSTRSVAMRDNINYGTSLLKTTVHYGADVLQDNNAAIQNQRSGAKESNKTFDVKKNTGQFELTGILIGGQEQTVGWNYLATTGSAFNCMVYDRDIPSTAIPTNGSGSTTPCYTLVWDNWDESQKGNKQRDVYVALEFVNKTGKDFWGQHNLVRNGGTFYLIGKLDPDKPSYNDRTKDLSTSDLSAGITWPGTESGASGALYALPPYGDDGKTLKQRRVFIQDYMTEANFVIGATSLQKALVTVPDLRSTQISLGLSVDLSWQTGIHFEDILLGY